MVHDCSVLLVEGDAAIARALLRVLVAEAYVPTIAPSCAAARGVAGRHRVGVFAMALRDGSGVSVAAELLAAGRIQSAVFFTSTADEGEEAEWRSAARLGAVVPKRHGILGLVKQLERAVSGCGVWGADEQQDAGPASRFRAAGCRPQPGPEGALRNVAGVAPAAIAAPGQAAAGSALPGASVIDEAEGTNASVSAKAPPGVFRDSGVWADGAPRSAPASDDPALEASRSSIPGWHYWRDDAG